MVNVKATLLAASTLALGLPALGQERLGSIQGTVKDPSGAHVPAARVEATGLTTRRSSVSDARGVFTLDRLPPGTYAILVHKVGFASLERTEVEVKAGQGTRLDLELALAPVEENVTVQEQQTPLTLSSASGAGAIVLKGSDLEALPDDPDELAEALQALAGPSAGPSGGQIYIDGFTGGRMPSKASIREIRVNASPFSAEYDRPGHGRIEILTKPGSEELQGQAALNFNSQALNTRDPFAANEPDYRRTVFGVDLSGPLPGRKASFTLEAGRRAIDDVSIVSGTTLDPSLQPVEFQRAVVTPQWRTTVNPRLDAQIGVAHTLSVEYEYESVERNNQGVAGFSLPSRAFDTTAAEHEVHLGGTSVFGRWINEVRFRWVRETRTMDPLEFAPSLEVQDAFSSGGAPVGVSSNRENRLELHEIVSRAGGSHSLRGGVRLRSVSLDDTSRRNFNGLVTFAGALGPVLDASNQPVLGPDGLPVLEPLTSIERYRRTLRLEGLGMSPERIRLLGGGPSQLLIAGGQPTASVSQWDLGAFVQDDWKARPDLLVGLGLRYEIQNNIKSDLDFSPRLTLAWSPGTRERGKSPKTVLRAGIGVFYDRVGESLTLDSHRYDGVSQQNFLVTDPEVLNQLSFLNNQIAGMPSTDELLAYALPQTVRLVASDIKAPRTTQWSLSLERALPGNLSFFTSYVGTRIDRALRSRVLNAPGLGGTQPGEADVVYQYESTGRFQQDQLVLGLNSRLSSKVGLSLRYTLGWARSDTDGASSFPSDSSHPELDWGRAGMDVRHRFMLSGRIEAPWGIRLSPLVIVSSGRPFNITTGRDNNADTVFNDRPAYAVDPLSPDVISTPWGVFDTRTGLGPSPIPRNLGLGPSFAVFNLRVSKTLSFGRSPRGPQPPQDDPSRPGPGVGGPPQGHGPGGGGHGPGGHGPGHGGMGESGGSGPGLTVSLSVQNLLNRTNPSTPVGNLSSPQFGQSLASAGSFGYGGGGGAGNRRVDLQMRLSF